MHRPAAPSSTSALGPLALLLLAAPALGATPPQGIEAEHSAPPVASRSVPIPPLRVDRTRLYWDELDDRVWVRGATFKALASPEGFRYVSSLGSEMPRNFPLELSLESVTWGEASLELDPRAAVSRRGDRLVLDRGAVDVMYDVALDSVEQAFEIDLSTLDGAPAGDLVVTLALDTDLIGAPCATGHRFDAPGELGGRGVAYGHAVAFDERGASVDVKTTLVDDRLALTVPGWFAEAAGERLVVDPLLSTFGVTTSPAALSRPQVAYHAGSHRYCVVFVERFSTSDADLYSVFVDPDEGESSQGTYVDMSEDLWNAPRIASVLEAGTFLVVASILPEEGDGNISGRVRDAFTGFLHPPFVIDEERFEDEVLVEPVRGDVGGDCGPLVDSNYLVTWEEWRVDRSSRVLARRYDPVGNPVDPEPFVLHEKEGLFTASPRISKSTGTVHEDRRWVVTWAEVEERRSGPGTVMASTIRWDATDVTPPIRVSSVDRTYTMEPSVISENVDPETEERTFVVTSENGLRYVSQCTKSRRIERRTIPNLTNQVAGDPQGAPVLTATGRHFVAAYGVGTPGGDDVRVTVLEPAPVDMGVTEPHVLVQSGLGRLGLVDVASEFSGSGDPSRDELLVVWADASPGAGAIQGTLFVIDSLDTCGVQFCDQPLGATGSTTFLGAYGNQSSTSPFLLYGQELPPDAWCIVQGSRTSTWLPAFNGWNVNACIAPNSEMAFGTADSLGRYLEVLYPTALPVPGGGGVTVPALPGDTFYFQVWHSDPATGVEEMTNAVRVTFQ